MKPRNLDEALVIIRAQRETIALQASMLRESMHLREGVRKLYARHFIVPQIAKKNVDASS